MSQKLIALGLQTGIAYPKFVLIRLSDGAFWNTSGTPAFEAYSAANIADYGIAATETGVTGIYTASNPSERTPCQCKFVQAAASSLAVADLVNNVFYEDNVGGPDVDGKTLEETLRIIAATTAGELRDAGTDQETFKGLDGTTDRVVADVDAAGNRSNVSYV